MLYRDRDVVISHRSESYNLSYLDYHLNCEINADLWFSQRDSTYDIETTPLIRISPLAEGSSTLSWLAEVPELRRD